MKLNKRFDTIDDMLAYLSLYRTYYYVWIALDADVALHSPNLESIPGASHTEVSTRWNKRIQKKDEYERVMRTIREDIERLKDVSFLSYNIIEEKFIYFRTLEEISLMLHYSLDHMKHSLYPKAKQDLFNLLNNNTESHPTDML
jgi:hypothetical protein